jgi:hypothetical protein
MFFKLPPPWTTEELRRLTVSIDPVCCNADPPFWSVVIPAGHGPDKVRAVLGSILCQDPGPAEMQILVLDNGSAGANIDPLVKQVAGDRVTVLRHEKKIADIECLNAGLNKTNGQWVHVLEPEHVLLPEFYEAYKKIVLSQPDLVMVQGTAIVVDDKENWVRLRGPVPAGEDCILKDYHLTIAVSDTACISATVVKRTAYEKVGGFPLIDSCQDWDLWFRVAQTGPVAGTDRPYVMARQLAPNYASVDLVEGKSTITSCQLHAMNVLRLGIAGNKDPRLNWRPKVAERAERLSWNLGSAGFSRGRLIQANLAFVIEPNWRRFRHLVKSWLKHKTHPSSRHFQSDNGKDDNCLAHPADSHSSTYS